MASATRSPFLHVLPAELRLHIYTLLLVTPSPLKGPVARESTKYDLHTAILRTNKQIHAEARSIFFGKTPSTLPRSRRQHPPMMEMTPRAQAPSNPLCNSETCH
ncbi:hypothetical protein P3342_005405 [Pyrenophora teres f. teres]|nr:hypothetical protein P3342_005405 [Pyrenophora teres f. teres]